MTGWGAYQYDPTNDVLRVAVIGGGALHRIPHLRLRRAPPDRRSRSCSGRTSAVPLKIDVPERRRALRGEMRKDCSSLAGIQLPELADRRAILRRQQDQSRGSAGLGGEGDQRAVPQRRPGREDFSTLRTKASVLRAMARDADADAVMDKAVGRPAHRLLPIHHMACVARREQGRQGDGDLLRNRQQHPEDHSSPTSVWRAAIPRSATGRMRSRTGKSRSEIPPGPEAQPVGLSARAECAEEGPLTAARPTLTRSRPGVSRIPFYQPGATGTCGTSTCISSVSEIGQLFTQIAQAVVDDICRGRLGSGDRLPGTRTLARTIGVDRVTVLAAYDELAAEGWVTTHPARGPSCRASCRMMCGIRGDRRRARREG